MNFTKTIQVLHNDFLQSTARALKCAQNVDLPHVFVGALFIFVLRARTTYPPLSIPAFFLASYYEWCLYTQDDIVMTKYSLFSLLISWLVTFSYRLAKRRAKMHNLVSLLTFPSTALERAPANSANIARNTPQPILRAHPCLGQRNPQVTP